MRTGPDLQLNRKSLFWLTFVAAICLIVGKSIVLGAGLDENFAKMGNDDIMRLTVVRDLIAGQSWFDTTQYRMVPPEGLSLHWSRYIDAGIAAIILPLSLVIEMDLAEQIAVAIWPTLIFLLTLVILGLGTRRVFDAPAASFAMLCLVIWPLTADVHSRPGNLDHHNVQFLMMLVMVLAIIWPDGVKRAGVVAGLSAAFSLAVGLEGVLFIIVAGLVLVVRSAIMAEQSRLVTFCIALVVGCCLLWLGQAPPNARFIPVCDQLGTPMLGLVSVAAVASLLPLIVLRGSDRPVIILGATVILTGVGLSVVWPLLGPCFSGPYGNLPEALQTYIRTSIVEAKPALVYAKTNAVPAFIFLLPVIAAVLLGGWRWLSTRHDTPCQENSALGILLVFCVFGLGLVFYQMRTVIVVATVVPIIGGVVMAQMLAAYLKKRDSLQGLLMLCAQIAFIAPTLIANGMQAFLPNASETENQSVAACRTNDSLQILNAIPPGVILSHGNLGASIIWATHHDALAAPYHRSAAALGNGILPFAMGDREMEAYVRDTAATHLLLCRDQTFAGAFATSLAAGAQVDWLVPVPLDDAALMLFALRP